MWPSSGAHQTLTDDTSRGLFLFSDTNGTLYEFDDFSHTDARSGQFYETIYPSGQQVAKVSSWNGAGQISQISYQAFDPNFGDLETYEQHDFYYYTTGSDAGRLQYLEDVRYDQENMAGYYVSLATYSYYQPGDPNGLPGDLETVFHQAWTGDSFSATRDTWYYRYYTDSTNALELALSPQEYQNAVLNLGNNLDSTSISASQLKPYSSEYYEYTTIDSLPHVTTAIIGGQVTHPYTYSYSAPTTSAGGYNDWTTETTEARPDASTYKVYTNFLGEILVTDLADSSGNHWYAEQQYGDQGYNDADLVLSAMSSAIMPRLE